MSDIKLVAVLGPEGSYGHEAFNKSITDNTQGFFQYLLDDKYEIVYCDSNVEILEKVESKEVHFGIVPIENSSAGLVREVVDFWLRHLSKDIRGYVGVISEIQIPINHNLLARQSVSEISALLDVISHSQALAQCAKSLRDLDIKLHVASLSTAAAAKKISQSESACITGAIASIFAAEIYGLKILKENLNDFPGNATRFHIIGSCDGVVSGNRKTAIIFKVANKAGSLVKALSIIGDLKINMTSIHSISLGNPGEYAFYCEFEEGLGFQITRKILDGIESASKVLHFLGSFPKGV